MASPSAPDGLRQRAASEFVPVHGSGVRSVFYHLPDQKSVQQDAEEKGRCSIKLWIVLEAVFLGVFLALAAVLCALWLLYNAQAIKRMSKSADYVLREFNTTARLVLEQEVMRAHQNRVQSVYTIIKDMAGDPSQLSSFNARVFRMQRAAGGLDDVSRSIEVLWPEAGARQWYADFVYYADSSGFFSGFARDVLNDGDDAPFEFIYQPPIDQSSVALVCPRICPQGGGLEHGFLYAYSADEDTGQVSPAGRDAVPFRLFTRPWYTEAIKHRGEVIWTGPYLFSNRNTFGMTASIALPSGNAAFDRVFGSDLAFDIFSNRLVDMSRSKWERTFIVQSSGELIASSLGYNHVVRIGRHGERTTVGRTMANESGDTMITRTMASLLTGRNGSLADLPSIGAELGAEGDVIFAWVRWQPDPSLPHSMFSDWIIFSVQDSRQALQKVTDLGTALRNFTRESVEETTEYMQMRSLSTIGACVLITIIGAVLLAFLAHSIVQPLKFISRDMRSLAKLEFMRAQKGDDEEDDGGDLMGHTFTDGVVDRSPTVFRSGDDVDGDSGEDEESGGSSGSDSSRRGRGGDGRICPRCPLAAAAALQRSCRRCFRKGRVQIKEVAMMRDAFNYMSNGLRSFARYMDPNVLQMVVDSNRQAQLGVARVEVTVFFSDIANFTTMAEELDPEAFMRLLAEYLHEMSSVIMKYQGVVGEFIGDAIMAWWNAPVTLSNHTALALRAALAQQALLSQLRKQWRRSGKPDVRARMGLVRGAVLAGNIGSSSRMKFGLVGDSVNLASRLEGLCKRYHVNILIEESARSAPWVEEDFLCRPLDLVIVKGRSHPTEIFELVALKGAVAGTDQEAHYQRYVADFVAIHKLYRSGAFSAALEAVDVYLETWPQDFPAQMMRERCEALLESPPGDHWTPVERLREK